MTDEEITSRLRAWFGDIIDIQLSPEEVKISLKYFGSVLRKNGPSPEELDGLCESLLNAVNHAHVNNHFPHCPAEMTLKSRLATLQSDLDQWKVFAK